MKRKIILYAVVFVIGLFLLTSIPIHAYSNDMGEVKTSQGGYDVEKGRDWYYKPDNYAELVSWYETLESNFPEYIEIFNASEMYGTDEVTGGYYLKYVRITNESLGFHKPEVLFLGGIHGDETVGNIGMYWFLDWFTRKAFTDEECTEYSKEWLNWIVDNREIYFIITHNPYGFDHGPQRYDGNGWDLNREGDYDGPGDNVPSIWASENGKTLYRFVNNHTFRVGCDIHGGVRMLLYPWASTYHTIYGTSPISGESYEGAPPDFYFYDSSSLRVGAYMGNGGGDGPLNQNNIGTIDSVLSYTVHGGIAPWAYAADVVANPLEDQYVEDEVYGNYPGAGILWISPEMSYTKNPPESTFGNDTTDGWGWEMRRFILHQTDIAQPYVRWQPGTIENEIIVETGEPIPLRWQINGSMVVDHTMIQWGTNPNPIDNYDQTTTDIDTYAGEYIGGTGWENANDGITEGVFYQENLTISTPGDYYFVAKAQVDQVYANILSPETYGNDPYLRLIKERTNESYYETLTGTDGVEEIIGQTWWYSPVIHITVVYPEPHDILVSNLEVYDTISHNDPADVRAVVLNNGMNDETNIEINFTVDGTTIDSLIISSLVEDETQHVNFTWNPDIGTYTVGIEATPVPGETVISNNGEYKTVNVIAAPIIEVDPLTIDFLNTGGLILTENLTIENNALAEEALHYNITISNDPWLSTDITTGTIQPGNLQQITVEANIDGLAIGNYYGEIYIDSNDPEEPTITIPVSLTILYASDVGATIIHYPTGTIGPGSYIINASIENYGLLDQTDLLVNCSIYEGGLGGDIYFTDFSINPTDWTITNIAGTAWSWDSSDERMEHTYSGSPSGYLDSPVMDCSGKTGVSLSFWHYWRADYSGANQDGYVRGSIDGGSTFPYLIDEFHHNDPAEETAVKEYDISSWADGQTDVMIRFDVTNDNDWYWYIDDFNVSAELGGEIVYYDEELVDIPAFTSSYVEFSPAWNAVAGTYGIQVRTILPEDQDTSNDVAAEIVYVVGPELCYTPTEYDFGTILLNGTDSTTFEIWNCGEGTLSYTLTESYNWVDVSPLSGDSTGEHDTITIEVDTTGLSLGEHQCEITIDSNGGTEIFTVTVIVISDSTPMLDVNQSLFDRGFPIRHAADGDWAAAQSFLPTMSIIPQVELYMRSFGVPEFDLVVELRQDGPEGTILDTVVFTPAEIPSAWSWVTIDFSDTSVTPSTEYFIVCPPAPSGVTTSFGYEWGYAFGDQYGDGAFWFTRDGGALWRDLPTSYEFTFKTYGYP